MLWYGMYGVMPLKGWGRGMRTHGTIVNVSFDALACLLASSVVCLSDVLYCAANLMLLLQSGKMLGSKRIERDTYRSGCNLQGCVT